MQPCQEPPTMNRTSHFEFATIPMLALGVISLLAYMVLKKLRPEIRDVI